MKGEPLKREFHRKGSVVNVNPTNIRPQSDTPEIRKYKKKFNAEVLWTTPLACSIFRRQTQRSCVCVHVEECVWFGSAGVNLLVGTENGLWLLDRSGQGKVYSLISRRRFQQMDVLEGLNVLITISVRYEKIKFLVIALKNAVEVYAWAPKPYHKFMAFKGKNLIENLTGSPPGDEPHTHTFSGPIHPHAIIILPNKAGTEVLVCYEDEGVYIDTYGRITKDTVLQWGEMPTSVFFASVQSGGSSQIYFMTLGQNSLFNW
ncbi:hypothetical protein XENOCAPTIV_029421 [Xenoophorus captivus]|uniref:non-specific serine/threonine protein kinase n=1 Tax=Xenoophorus captivus TaxID=1517983 RepID=A0ABV0QF54_9TELE